MISPKSYFCFFPITASIFMAAGGSSLHGQELAANPPTSRKNWRLGAVLAAAYDSNIFLNSTQPKADAVYRLGALIAYRKGDPQDGEGGYVSANYQPTAVVYQKNSSENRVDQQAQLTLGWRGKATAIGYAGGVRQLGDATADVGRQTDRLESRNELRGTWLAGEKLSFEAAVGRRQTNYKDTALFDSSKTYGEAVIRYAYSPKTRLGLGYQAGRFQVNGSPAQTTHQLTGQVEWQPREKINLRLEAGAERRQTQRGSQLKPVAEGRIDWAPREGTKLYLAGYQREESSAFFAGQNYTQLGITAGMAQRLGDRWTARLEAGRESSKYSRASGAAVSDRRDRGGFVKPSLEYQFNDALDVTLFYKAAENRSNSGAFGYEQRLAGVELNYQF
jgi:hypothetical protein